MRGLARPLRELAEFVGFPSVSAQPRHAADVAATAGWLGARLRAAGLEASVIPTPRHPVVLAAWRGAPDRPTVLVYGHYDVQPVDPVRAWRSAPFTAQVRGDRLYGRGASDDKGQLLCHVLALERLLRERGRLPVNVVCLFEGEEEIGSPSLPDVLDRHRAALAADVAVCSDTRMLGPGIPALTYALRGTVVAELTVSGPATDVHSGTYGGAVHNPLQVLCELVASLHGPDGRVRVRGFYDGVASLSGAELARMRRDGPHDADMLRAAGVAWPWGSGGSSVYERTTAWPALTINGLSGGYQGPHGKSVIPARASAKLSARLVADQDPARVAEALARHVARHTPPTARARLTVRSATAAVRIDRSAPAMAAAAAAYRHGFGAAPVLLRSGGTIAAVALFQQALGLDTVLLGFGLPDDHIHAPNESFHLPTFRRGITTAARFLDEVAAIGKSDRAAGMSADRWPSPRRRWNSVAEVAVRRDRPGRCRGWRPIPG